MTAIEIVKNNYNKSNEEIRKLLKKHKKNLTNKQISNIKYREKIKNCNIHDISDMSDMPDINVLDEVLNEICESDNKKTIDIKSNKNPKTLDDLLEICNVDKNIWKVEKYVVNKWEVASKDKNNNVINTPLYQIKAFLERIVPIETNIPALNCIVFKASEKNNNCCKNDKKQKNTFEKALIIPDSHNGYSRKNSQLIEFHDKKAWSIALQIAKDSQPDRIVLLGDMLDFAELSDKFIKSPDFYWTIQPAVVELSWYLSELRTSVPNAKIDYLEGNHERRLTKSIINNLIAVYDLKKANNPKLPVMSVQNLLCLDEYNIQYHSNYPNDEIWLNNHLSCNHGSIARNESGDTAKAILRNARCSEIIGHIHRQEMICTTKFSRKGPSQYKVFCPGTIARIDGVVPANKASNNWQQGLAMVHYETNHDELFEINPITINEGRCIYNDKLYVGNNNSFHNMLNSIDSDFAELWN